MMMKTIAAPAKLSLFIAIGLAVAAAGCNNNGKPPQPKTDANAAAAGASSAPAASPAPERKLVSETKLSGSDAALTAKVKSALAREAGVDPQSLAVDANSGVVVLKGKVTDDATKQRIEEVAKAVPGVTWVQSQLSVVPPVAPKAG